MHPLALFLDSGGTKRDGEGKRFTSISKGEVGGGAQAHPVFAWAK